MDDIERYKADMARAREAGITLVAIRDIMNAYAEDGPDGESFGRMVERIRELALQAADRMAAEDRAAVVAYLLRDRDTDASRDAAAEDIQNGEHRRKENT